jgi:thiol-disulfide isomerase/thioredoxin
VGCWQQERADKHTIALSGRGTSDENEAKASEHGLTRVLLQKGWEVSEAYEVRGTPRGVVVRSDGTMGSTVAGSAEALHALVRQAVEAPARVPLLPGAPAPAAAPNGNGSGPCPKCGKEHPAEAAVPALEIGEPAPEIKLADLSGEEIVDLKEHISGKDTLVLFWNPGCGFCQQMLPDVKEWESHIREDAPELLVVSAGTEEANREMSLGSKAVLDQQFATGREFGASGGGADLGDLCLEDLPSRVS